MALSFYFHSRIRLVWNGERVLGFPGPQTPRLIKSVVRRLCTTTWNSGFPFLPSQHSRELHQNCKCIRNGRHVEEKIHSSLTIVLTRLFWKRKRKSFFKKIFVEDINPLGRLIPLFWTFGDISCGFQSQSGQPYSHLAEAYSLRKRKRWK